MYVDIHCMYIVYMSPVPRSPPPIPPDMVPSLQAPSLPCARYGAIDCCFMLLESHI